VADGATLAGLGAKMRSLRGATNDSCAIRSERTASQLYAPRRRGLGVRAWCAPPSIVHNIAVCMGPEHARLLGQVLERFQMTLRCGNADLIQQAASELLDLDRLKSAKSYRSR
jgi:hypothetical protein